MNKKIVSIIFLILAIFISLALGSYNFLISDKPASLPPFLDSSNEGAPPTKPTVLATPTKPTVLATPTKPVANYK